MANTQLMDYVKGQLGAGVSREAILGALRAAGWAEAEILESVKSAEEATSVTVVGATAAEKNFVVVRQTAPAAAQISKAQESPASMPGFSPAKMFSDIDVGKKTATLIPPMSQEKKGAMSTPHEASASSLGSFLPPVFFGFSFKKEWLTPSIFTAVIMVCATGLFFLYRSNADISSQLAQERAANQASAASLGAQIAKLTSDSAALASDRDAATQNANRAETELGFFVIPKNTSAASPLLVDVRGTLGGTAPLYTLLTADGIVANIKNSKDASVAAVLKPLLGTVADVVGTHLPASRDLTAVSINGISVQAVSSITAATSSASTTAQ